MYLKIENFTSKNVENFYYLGSILNADNKINTETAKKKQKATKHIITIQN
jgi:hypothetical protein